MSPRSRLQAVAAITAVLAGAAPALADCRDPSKVLGVSRVVEIDSTGGPIFGSLTKLERAPAFLERKEVVLTFDDGPKAGVTGPILDTLDRFCTKATFFAIGDMAVAYPALLRDVVRRGHTVASHTWSHPNNLRRLQPSAARDQIERGFAAVTLAAGIPIAPFFRFPGLSDSTDLVAYLGERGVATFTVDVVSNDSYISSPDRLVERTLKQLDGQGGGIMLFHDIKPQTARALPTILAAMKQRGYRVVHIVPKQPFVADARHVESIRELVVAKNPASARVIASAPLLPTNEGPVPAAAASATVAPSHVPSGTAEPHVEGPTPAAAENPAASRKRRVATAKPGKHRAAVPAAAVLSGQPEIIRGSYGSSRRPSELRPRPVDWPATMTGRMRETGN
jgi:peptidoglycan/xylan/chitin deacetylase (PgdA/CDA1 family)